MATTGVIFDVDGTLADPNYLHVLAWARAFRDAGEDVASSDIHRQIGMGSELLVEELLGHPDEDATDGHTRHFTSMMSEIRAFPRAGELMVEVHERGALAAIASSANAEQLEAMLAAIGAPEGTIDHIVGPDDVDESKPEPDVFQAALEGTGLDAANVVGLEVVGVLTCGICRCELEDAGAFNVYDDVAAILADLDRSPLGRLVQAPTDG